MDGTIMRGRVKQGRREELQREFADVTPRHREHGLVSAEIAWEAGDSGRFLEIIHFRDRVSYERNAARPETDADFRRLQELLDGDPEWIDVEYGVSTEALVRT